MSAKKQTKSELKDALISLSPYFKKALVFTVLSNLLSLAPVGYMRDVYGPVVNSRSMETLVYVTLLLFGFLLISGFLDWIRARIFASASAELGMKLSERVFDATFTANLQSNSQGAQQALHQLKEIRNFIASPTIGILFDAPVSIFFLVLVFNVNPRLGIVATCSALIMFFITGWTERQVRPAMAEAHQAAAQAQSYVQATIRNAQVIEAMGMLGSVQDEWRSMQQKFVSGQNVASNHQVGSSAASKFVMLIQGSSVLGIGCWLTINGYLQDGGAAMVIASILGGKSIQPMLMLISAWSQVVTVRDSIEKLENFLAAIPVSSAGMSLPAPKGKLSVENVTIQAPNSRNTIVKDISFILPAGNILAVIGASGSGKSSLGKALIGIWPSISGKVRLDGVDIFSWNKVELGPYLGYLPQDIELFDGSLAENIARFGQIDEDLVMQAISLVGLTGMIEQLPDGIHSRIGEEGAVLSGGQRQRVGLARAIYGTPKLLVLDEPNSSLDNEGDQALMKALVQLKKQGTTIVIISHRKGVLSISDAILFLKSGKLKVFGPRDKVLEKLGIKTNVGLQEKEFLQSDVSSNGLESEEGEK